MGIGTWKSKTERVQANVDEVYKSDVRRAVKVQFDDVLSNHNTPVDVQVRKFLVNNEYMLND